MHQGDHVKSQKWRDRNEARLVIRVEKTRLAQRICQVVKHLRIGKGGIPDERAAEIVDGASLAVERRDRLPLLRAREEAESWFDLSPHAFIVRVFEIWVIAQHTYWCVTRGLADARNGGKIILRMRIVMDENGWALTPQTTLGNRPEVTPDRLDTAVELLRECRRLDWTSNG